MSKLKSINLTSKFDELIKVIKENPFQTPPPYEKLPGLPYCSRRLNIKHRLVTAWKKRVKRSRFSLFGHTMNVGYNMLNYFDSLSTRTDESYKIKSGSE
ncbi:Txe/YoeB family addiction module toxin [Enterococcus sp. PF-2]|nr:Txe/YoeB family addiction module toxin [Enterococcus sp. CR-Ec1]MBO1123404.1 Txe/YoeB family addiction module toxin [Enterococcus casseliflavus]TPE01519.1 Txe/YoeB family addiction module toxin [Enterococcus sp. PF-3]TPE24974.1 Txe/YoeB family addiction module toxin [Enterococcus sp. PF-2]